MRRIGTLETKQHAESFAGYLTVQGIASQVEEDNGEWSIWIKEEDHLDESRTELANFRQNSDDPRYAKAALEAQQVREQERQRIERAARNTVDMRQTWNRPFTRRAPLTSALIAVSVVVGLMSDSVFQPQTGAYVRNTVFRTLAFFDPLPPLLDRSPSASRDSFVDIRKGQVWRLVTPAVLHLGLTHLIFNMIMLYSLGGLIESRQKATRVAILFLICSTAGNVGQHLLSDGTGVGMSGVVYGLFGYVWIYSLLVPQESLGVRNDMIVILLVWLLLGFSGVLEQLIGVSIANWAHLFGMLAGMLVAVAVVWLNDNLKKKSPPKPT